MIFDPYNPVFNTVFVYILIISFLVIHKPYFIYNKRKRRFKQFGVGRGKSLLSLPILAILLPVILYSLFRALENYVNIQDEYLKLINKSMSSSYTN
uniref:Uncharacterized protein n=1 Tax=viral metagenome TaxID=1070528 RepID=A0A6C0EAM1_9ZZZZ